MRLFAELMKNDEIKRSVLIEFGFGNVNKLEVVKWVKEKYPFKYFNVKKGMESIDLIEFAPREIEMMTAEERTSILNQVLLEKGVRTQFLDIGEKATDEIKVVSIAEEQALMFAVGQAVSMGDVNALNEATAKLMAYKNRHIKQK